MKTPAHIRERNRQWRLRNPEQSQACTVAWQKKNWERYLEYHRKWAKENRDKIRPKEDRWKAENPEKVTATIKNWREANKERYRLIMRGVYNRRRERLSNVQSCDKTSENILFQLVSDSPRLKCGICGKNMPKSDRTIDHVIPVSKGGSGEIWNLRIVHMRCNSAKGSKVPDELPL